MSIQRKVTSFVTRRLEGRPQLLVFHHAASGIQVPAGTVEPGEEFEAAARREAREETGLMTRADLAVVQRTVSCELLQDRRVGTRRLYRAGPRRRWRQQAEEEHEFELFWTPLEPRPTILVEGQQEWLDEFYPALL